MVLGKSTIEHPSIKGKTRSFRLGGASFISTHSHRSRLFLHQKNVLCFSQLTCLHSLLKEKKREGDASILSREYGERSKDMWFCTAKCIIGEALDGDILIVLYIEIWYR